MTRKIEATIINGVDTKKPSRIAIKTLLLPNFSAELPIIFSNEANITIPPIFYF